MSASLKPETPWRQFICRACGVIYDEEQGDPDSGIAPGTRFDDIPDDWVCPVCGVVKADFEPYVAVAVTASTQPTPATRGTGVIIVGGGCAGWTMAETLRALDPSLPITLVSGCRGDRYHKPELSVALSRGVAADALVRERGNAAARRLGVALLAETFVVGISPSLHRLRTTRGTLRYTALVLAQGARPMLPPALPASLCWNVNHLSGWSGLRERLNGAKKQVAIVGAGMVGCELAEDLARAGHAVTLLDTQAQPLAALLPQQATQRLRTSLEQLGVRIVAPVQVTQVTACDDGGKRITTACGQQIDADEVVAATGLAADARLARSAGLAFDRGIVVDPATLQTSAPDIYALGDCISIDGAPCRFIEPIAKQASAIAHAIQGQSYAGYAHSAPLIRLKTRSLPIVLHGRPCAEGEWRVLEESDDCLCMQQWDRGDAVASLEVGSRLVQRFAS